MHETLELAQPPVTDLVAGYIQDIGITWDVVAYIATHPEITSQMQTHADARRHVLYLSADVGRDPDGHRYDIIHELGHGRLAEITDPIIANPSIIAPPGVPAQQAGYYGSILQATLQYTDMWVDDRVSAIDPHAHERYKQPSLQRILNAPLSTIRENQILTELLFAVGKASVSRYGLTSLAETASRALHRIRVADTGLAARCDQLAQAYADLPRLPENSPANAVSMFRDETMHMARIMQIPITPRLIRWEGKWTWTYDLGSPLPKSHRRRH